jgi:hypothetical protein
MRGLPHPPIEATGGTVSGKYACRGRRPVIATLTERNAIAAPAVDMSGIEAIIAITRTILPPFPLCSG